MIISMDTPISRTGQVGFHASGRIFASRSTVSPKPDGTPLEFWASHEPTLQSGNLRQSAAQMTIFDTHEHFWHEDVRLRKKVDFFLLFSHYTSDDLISAGMSPQLVADLQDPGVPLEKRWKDFAPYWPYTRTTGYGRCMLIAARDLFGIEDINEKTYLSLSERI